MNALFKSLVDTVVINTNRPNLISEISSAIQQETLAFHNRGQFKSDVKESILTSTNGGQAEYRFSIPQNKRVRKLLSVRPLDPHGRYGKALKQVDPFDGFCDRNYGFSWFNNVLNIKIPYPATTFGLIYLEFPNVSQDGYNSWIAQRYPHYITDAATARILIIREKAQATFYQNKVGDARVPGSHIYDLLNQNEEVYFNEV